MTTLAIALNTYREAIRDKVLYVLIFFAGVAILGSKAIGFVTIGQDVKIIADISLASISVFGALISIFVGTSLIYKEIDKRTIYTILSQPIRRYEFVIGKYLGLAILLAVVTAIMTGISAGYLLVMGGEVNGMFIASVGLIYMKLLMVTALSVLLSALTSPILGAIIVFSCYVFGHGTGILIDLPPHIEGTWVQEIMKALYYVFPNLANFDIWPQYSNGVPVTAAYVTWAAAYGAVYTLMLLFLAAVAFENKDV